MQEGWGDVLHGVEKRAARLARPVFDGGRLRAQGELSEARFDELLAHYRATTLQAFSEVDLALGEIESLARQDEQQALVGLYRSLGGAGARRPDARSGRAAMGSGRLVHGVDRRALFA